MNSYVVAHLAAFPPGVAPANQLSPRRTGASAEVLTPDALPENTILSGLGTGTGRCRHTLAVTVDHPWMKLKAHSGVSSCFMNSFLQWIYSIYVFLLSFFLCFYRWNCLNKPN